MASPSCAACTDWVDLLRDGVDFNEKHPGPDSRDYTKGTPSGRFFGDYCNWHRIEPFRRFVEESPAAGIAKELMASKRARIFHKHVGRCGSRAELASSAYK